MTQEEREYLQSCIKNEGFDYCFRHYSSFAEIKDEEFQKVLEDYRLAGKRLEQYIDDEEVYKVLHNIK